MSAVPATALALAVDAARAPRPNRLKPQVDDVLVHAFGARAGDLLGPRDWGGERLFAFPRSPDGVVRDGSLHNQVALVRLNETAMSERTRPYAAGPFVAYSAACTHTGCEVNGWVPDDGHLVCPCHGSHFDIHDAAKVAVGPAPKPLAMLPIALENGSFRVTGAFFPPRRAGTAVTL